MINKDFCFELHCKNDLKEFLDKILDYQEEHIAGRFENMIYAEAYYNLKICLEELIFNSFKHGYEGKTEKPHIIVTLQKKDNALQAKVLDNANHFDPITSVPQSQDGVVLGINLIKKLVDSIKYEKMENGNKVILIKKISE